MPLQSFLSSSGADFKSFCCFLIFSSFKYAKKSSMCILKHLSALQLQGEKEVEATSSQYFLSCHNFHQPKFELAPQAHYISLPETLIKGLRKLLRTCQRHHSGIGVVSLLSFLAHCSRDHSLRVILSAWVLSPCFPGMSRLSAPCIQPHLLGSGNTET